MAQLVRYAGNRSLQASLKPCYRASCSGNENRANNIMKSNLWTSALISAGLLSLPGASYGEEKPSPVVTALASTTLSGYVDTSAHWNLGTGNQNLPAYTPNG